jgi:hypothetical protein
LNWPARPRRRTNAVLGVTSRWESTWREEAGLPNLVIERFPQGSGRYIALRDAGLIRCRPIGCASTLRGAKQICEREARKLTRAKLATV